MHTYRVDHYNVEVNERALRSNLDLLEETREEARVRMIEAKKKAAKFFNRRVRARQFSVGDLVLQRNIFTAGEHNKLQPNWEGPFRVGKVVGPATYDLETLAGEKLPRPFHAEHLRKYHQ